MHANTHTGTYTYTNTFTDYILVYEEMLDFGKSDKMMNISGKEEKSDTYKGFGSNVSSFINGRTSSD